MREVTIKAYSDSLVPRIDRGSLIEGMSSGLASAIILLYLEEMSGVQVSTMTTPELIARSEQISPSQRRAIIEFFTALDRLNFAACSITEEDFRRTYREAENIVDHI